MKKGYNIAFVILCIIVLGAWVGLIFNNAVWYDETYSMAIMKHSLSEICSITALSEHPPLYYWALHIFTAPFGYSLTAAKLISVIPLILTMILGYIKLSGIAGKRAGFLFAAMFSFLPIMSIFAVEVRMYTLAAFFVTGCGLFAFTAQRGDKPLDYVIFALFGTAAAYTHYFALVSAGIIYIMLFIKCIKDRKIKKFLLAASGTALLYLPWLHSFIGQLAGKVNNAYWISPITPSTVIGYFKVWFGCGGFEPYYFIGIALSAVIAAAGIIKSDKHIRAGAICGALVFFLTAAVGVAASVLVRPVFLERYAIPSIGLLIAALAVGISALDIKGITAAVTVFFFAGFCANYPAMRWSEYHATEPEIGEVINSGGYDALICYVNAHLYGVLSYYSETAPVYRPKLSPDVPFENMYALSELDISKCKRAALFVPKGDPIPAEIADEFDAQYTREVATYGIECDMYDLTPKAQ